MNDFEKETTKLIANAFDRASTSCLTVGVLAPIAGSLYSVDAMSKNPALLLIAGALYVFAAGVLHWSARRVLRGLIP